MSRVPLPVSLLPDSAQVSDDDTVIGGVSLAELAREFGTPLFVYDEQTLRSRCRDAASAFDHGVAFASKSFLCAAMARLAVEEGLCIDVSTGGELDLVVRAGVPGSRIVLHGNNKSVDELARAHAVGVRHVVVDNFDEIERLRSVVKPGDQLACLVRVTPGVEAHTHEFVQTGHEDTKFGFSIASGDARRAIDELRSVDGVVVDGVHAHIGSQIFDLDGFRAALGIVWHFIRDDDFRELCIGGGLGVAYVEGESALSIADWGAQLREWAAELGVPFEKITIRQTDTDELRAGSGTGGSKSLMCSGTAIVEASAKVVEKGKQAASHFLEAAVADIQFGKGRFSIAGTTKPNPFSAWGTSLRR